ncbi:hypothetical protein [Streptomyces sp. B15]|uniref:hypothetical protein n=1 Tax=Streptomyces sp. B15 TaxID=1537797 RepID=UPI001B37BFB1|nr:hypothetical protein [Streptomyces sp. B15]MBQ1122657.1 hypothetical protein [Streptomyces sp. B15]
MDPATLGTLLVGIGAVVGALVTWAGKRGENALTGYTTLTDQLQEERDRLERQLAERSAALAELHALRAADQAEIARLRGIITRYGGDPS